MRQVSVAWGLAIAATAGALAPTSAGAVQEDCPAPARSSRPAWPPPAPKGSFDVVHFGEAHWNEGQGPLTMPILVQDVRAFDPDFVLFSSDIADIGTYDRLECFRSIMSPLDRARIPWFDSPGNHDRVAIGGPGGLAYGDISIWREVFASAPAPWGDESPPTSRFVVPDDEPDDGEGASTHYYFDYRGSSGTNVRVVVLDNSQHGLTSSDPDQYPAVGPGEKDSGQLMFLERVASEAQEDGSLVVVVMHQPTQDPRDLSNVHPISWNHTMGKGASPDNLAFDAIASTTGVDAVLLGHIQGNAMYTFGDTRYFIDGGGGGSPYALRETGTDTGYFYGFRILRVSSVEGSAFDTYFVPLVEDVVIEGPPDVPVGETVTFTGTAHQPFNPDLPPRAGVLPNEPIELELRPVDPSQADAASVPALSYMWKTSNPSVLAPVPADVEDASFDPRSMSPTGAFEAVRPGRATISVMVGTHMESIQVVVTRAAT